MERLAKVYQRLRAAGIKLRNSKCEILKEKVLYLGHIVSTQRVATDPEKTLAVREWKPPRSVKELQAFLRTTGYYRQYVKQYPTVAKPLHKFKCKDTHPLDLGR